MKKGGGPSKLPKGGKENFFVGANRKANRKLYNERKSSCSFWGELELRNLDKCWSLPSSIIVSYFFRLGSQLSSLSRPRINLHVCFLSISFFLSYHLIAKVLPSLQRPLPSSFSTCWRSSIGKSFSAAKLRMFKCLVNEILVAEADLFI